MIQIYSPPLDPMKPTRNEDAFVKALRETIDEAVKVSQETHLAELTVACDGNKLAFVGDGSSCHDAAKAGAGGQLGLAVKIGPGGQHAVITAELGRAMLPIVGYGGVTPGSPIPNPLAIGAAELGIEPQDGEVLIDLETGNVSELDHAPTGLGDPPTGDWSSGSDFAGLRIYGHTGGSRRMAVCFGDAAKARFWNDITSGSGSEGSLALGLWHVIPWNDERCFLFTQGFYNSDVPRWYRYRDKAGDTETLELDGFGAAIDDWETGLWIIATASACNRDFSLLGMIAHALAEGGVPEGRQAIVIASGQYLPGPTGSDINVPGIRYMGSTVKAMVDHKVMCFDYEGTVYIGARWYQTALPDHAIIKKVFPPYTPEASASQITYFEGETWGQDWDDFPTPLVGSRDGRYMASTRRAGDASCVDLWALPVAFPPPLKSLQGAGAAAGAQIRGIGTMAFGPDGTLFAVVGNAGVPSYLLVWTKGDNEWGDDPEVITLTYDAGANGWLSVSADGQTVVVSGYTAGAMTELQIVQAPFTSGGATVTTKSLSNALTSFAFDQPANFAAWSNGLRVSGVVRSSAAQESAVRITSRLTWTAAEAAWGVELKCPLDPGNVFVSATNGGEYIEGDHAVYWWIGTVAGDDEGFVEVTVDVGA